MYEDEWNLNNQIIEQQNEQNFVSSFYIWRLLIEVNLTKRSSQQ